MVTPFISSLAREVLKAVPRTQREGAYALGATRWEAIRVALSYGRTGIVGAIMLGFGRALGETMAVTMVIGNSPTVSGSLFAPQYTMSAVIANEFTEATDDLHLHALIEIGLVLFVITLFVNALFAMLIWSMNRQSPGKRKVKPEPAALGVPHDQQRKRPPPRRFPYRRGAVRVVGADCAGPARVHPLLRRLARRAVAELGFFTNLPVPVGETGGGMANAIVGTLMLTGLRRWWRSRSGLRAASTCRSTQAAVSRRRCVLRPTRSTACRRS